MTRDDVDRQILVELQQDGRRSFREIGRRLGVSERTVRQRVRRLESDGTLRIFAFVDPRALGASVLAMVLVKIDGDASESVIDAVVTWPEVAYVSSLIGHRDLYIQVVCRDNEELAHFGSKLRALPGVRDSETMVESSVHKFTYLYPDSVLRGEDERE